MSEPSAFGFGQFVPGFDFLQNLSKSAAQAQPTAAAMPGMGSWVAPTLSIEDIDKRIQELKSVLFWLEQNTTALKATIQAMEVQKMTLTTLQSMNVNMADLAKAFTVKPAVAEPEVASASQEAPKPSLFTPKEASTAAAQSEPSTPAEPPSPAVPTSEAAKPAVDPMQWWGALTQQFQGIAAAAMKDVAGEAMKAGLAAKSAQSVKTPAARQAAAGPASAAKSTQAPTPRRAKAPAKSVPSKAAKTVRAPAKSLAPARKTAKK